MATQFTNNSATVNYYEKTWLAQAKLIIETANLQFVNGVINYLEWAMLVNQSTMIQNNYLDALTSLNESIIEINYLTSKY